ncbi:MAG: DUF1570 domain-containing protein, partial [Candidatus Brocadiia bacterium]
MRPMRKILLLAVILAVLTSPAYGELQDPYTDKDYGFKISLPKRWESQPIPPSTDYEALDISEEQRKLLEDKEIIPLLINKESNGGTFRMFKLKPDDLESAEKMAREFARTKNCGELIDRTEVRLGCRKTKMICLHYERSQKWWDGTTIWAIFYFVANNPNGSFLLTYLYDAAMKPYAQAVIDSSKTFAYVEKKKGSEGDPVEDKYDLAPGWKACKTANYFIQYNEKSDERVKEFGQRIEMLHAAHVKVMQPIPELEEMRPVKQHKRFLIKYFKDYESFSNYAGDQGIGGAAAWYSPEQGEIAFFNMGWKRLTAGVLAHEGTHQFLQEFVGGPRVSFHIAFNEGMAEYFNGAVVGDSWKLAIGNVNQDCENSVRAAIRSGKQLQMPELVKMTQAQYYQIGRFAYDHGWALMYFLLHSKDKKYNVVVTKYFHTIQGIVFPILAQLADKGVDINKGDKKGDPKATDKPAEKPEDKPAEKAPVDLKRLETA